jgi:tetratricopeptide (TPR) repeat protein
MSVQAATKTVTSASHIQGGEASIFGVSRPWAYVLVPAFLAMSVYINTLGNGFAFDDEWMILKNPFIHGLRNLPFVLTTNPWAIGDDSSVSTYPYFRPAVAGLLIVCYRLFGEAAWGYHLVNALIHVGVTLLVFLAVKELTARHRVAVVCSILFAAHPAHVEAVAWISAVPEPLMAMFSLLSFLLYLRYRKTGRRYFIASASGLYFFALLSKETALALPLVIAFCDLFWINGSLPIRERMRRFLAPGVLFAIPVVAFLALRYNATGGMLLTYEPHFSWYYTFLSIPYVAVKYLGLLIIPAGYKIHHYTEPVETISSIAFAGPLLMMIALVQVIRLTRDRTLYFSAAWTALWMALPLAALAAFLPVYFVQERYLYLPSLGFCLAIAVGLDRLARGRRIARIASTGLCALLVVVWAAASITQNRVWKDSITLFEHNVAAGSRSPAAHASLALEYLFQRREVEAGEQARAAIDLGPDQIDGYIALSYIAENTGSLDQAIESLERATSAVSERPVNRYVLSSVYSNLGRLYAKRKEFGRAEESLQRATRMFSDPQASFELGQFYYERGRYTEARDLFEKTARQVSTRVGSVHLGLGRVYDRLGQPDRAQAEFIKYLRLSPRGRAREEVRNRLSQLDDESRS